MPPQPATPPSPILSGSDLQEQTEARKQHRSRIILLIVVVIVVLAGLLSGAYFLWGNQLGLNLFGPRLTNTTYTDNSGNKYSLSFYQGSKTESANNLSALAQNDKKLFNTATPALVSPTLGKYGSGVVLILGDLHQSVFFTDNKCDVSSGPTGFEPVFTTTMQDNDKSITVCGVSNPKTKRSIEYIFSFSQNSSNYVGIVLENFNWTQVTASSTAAADFENYAGLDKYQKQLKTIISSITIL